MNQYSTALMLAPVRRGVWVRMHDRPLQAPYFGHAHTACCTHHPSRSRHRMSSGLDLPEEHFFLRDGRVFCKTCKNVHAREAARDPVRPEESVATKRSNGDSVDVLFLQRRMTEILCEDMVECTSCGDRYHVVSFGVSSRHDFRFVATSCMMSGCHSSSVVHADDSFCGSTGDWHLRHLSGWKALRVWSTRIRRACWRRPRTPYQSAFIFMTDRRMRSSPPLRLTSPCASGVRNVQPG